MFFFPISTDAPIYHRPIGTVLLIVANLVCFVLTDWGMGDLAEEFMLEFGEGLDPLEWISCHFLHFGIFHLVGNLFFLLIFGFIVEGKIGTLPFLLVYFIIGWMGASLAQVMVQWETNNLLEGAGGASMVIFGLMMMSLLWAPRNEVGFVGFFIFFFVPRVFSFEATLQSVGIVYLLLNLLFAWLEGFSMGSSMGHLLGGVMGAGIGALMLKMNWVDCEGWDLFSIWKEDPTTRNLSYYRDEMSYATREQHEAAEKFQSAEHYSRKQKSLVKKFSKKLAANDAEAALEIRRSLSALSCDDLVPQEQEENLVKLLLQQQLPRDAVDCLENYVARFPNESLKYELKLCELLIGLPNRAADAMHRLALMDLEYEDEKYQKFRRKLIERAERRLHT